MTSEPTLYGFVARLQAKSDIDSEKLSFMECKHIGVVERVKKRKGGKKND